MMDSALSAAFAAAMTRFGPFERAPALAVGYSGGPDSGCALVLACDWAKARGGTVTALIFDHGLRPESAAEAAQAAQWAAQIGAAPVVLRPQRPIMAAGDVMAAAREARYAALLAYCGQTRILHLILGHHQDDQAETLLLRLARGSGLRGLAAMRPTLALGPAQLLRPLLDHPKARLRAAMIAAGAPFIDDPSNENPRFARPQLRQTLACEAFGGAARLAATAAALAADAAVIDAAAADLAARCVFPHPLGCARLDRVVWAAAPEALRLRVLADLLRWLSGAPHAPRWAGVDRLAARLAAGEACAVTLGGCALRARGDVVWIGREAAAQAAPVAVAPGATARWDARFALAAGAEIGAGWSLGPLGAMRPPDLSPPRHAPPRWLWPTAATLRHLDLIVSIPHLNYCRAGREADTMPFGALRPDPMRPFLP